MKKFLLSLTALAASFSLFAEDATLNLKGSGTADDPYQITNSVDLLKLHRACGAETAASASHYAGVYFKLTADIDMAGVNGYLGIGTAPANVASAIGWSFQGNFDGAGHRIKNLKIDGVVFDATGKAATSFVANSSRKFIGVFGNLGANGVIRNLIVDSTCYFTAANSVGGIVGNMVPGSQVENCANYGTIVCYDQNAGGIAGASTGTATGATVSITNCFNAGKVIANNKTVGGIIGNAPYTVITNCANAGYVAAYMFNSAATPFVQTQAGGIAGTTNGGSFTNCFNAGDVYATKEKTGGIVGYMTITTTMGFMKNCLNVGSVSAYSTYFSGQMIGGTTATGTTIMNTYTGCVYDNQLVASPFLSPGEAVWPSDEIKGLPTSTLVSGSTIETLGSSWKYRAGYYPIPATLDYPELDAAASTYILMPQGSTGEWLKAPATISSGTTASFAEATDLFSISGTTLTPYPAKGIGTAKIILAKNGFTRTVLASTFDLGMQGQGTESSPYMIATKANMMQLAKACNDVRARFAGTYFKLSSDIDMEKDEAFYGISTGFNVLINTAGPYLWNFCGTFDGADHTIKNLKMLTVKFDTNGLALNQTGGSVHNSGLFGSLGKGALIKNLTLDSSCYLESNGNTGGITGGVAGAATIDNCTVAMHIKTFGRYAGGFFGYSGTSPHIYPLTITNSMFSGLIESNYDYVGGISGWNGHADSKIINCINTGTIHLYHFNDCNKTTNALSRVGGITAINNSVMESCASYGPIIIEAPEECTKIDGVGGLVGQSSNTSSRPGSMVRNFTSSQVYIKGAQSLVSIGNLIGQRYYDATKPQGELTANYCDTQLNVQPLVVGAVNVAGTPTTQFHGLNTAALTQGAAIDSLASAFTFENGYYPMPKSWAQNAAVRAAAATFFILPETETIREINLGTSGLINTAMALTATLKEGVVFAIDGNRLRMKAGEGSDMLTLTNGNFSTIYPLFKVGTSGVDTIANELSDAVSVKYYGLDGTLIATPEKGSTVIAVYTLASGTTMVKKIIAE